MTHQYTIDSGLSSDRLLLMELNSLSQQNINISATLKSLYLFSA